MEPLEHFAFCPRCGSASSEPQDAPNQFKCPACGFTFYFNTATAVVGMILDAGGRILCIRREREPGKGMLAMPGGFVDAGESAEEALLREVREEVGLDLRDVTYFASYPNRYPYAGVIYSTLDIFFMCGTEDPSRAAALDAVSAVEWREPSGVRDQEIAFESMKAAIRAYRSKT
jgi:ADP-ribose pyrophosphatase YjhB (NUDIX family)